MQKLEAAPGKELISMKGGEDRGDPCEPFACHGFNGSERVVVAKVAEWLVAK